MTRRSWATSRTFCRRLADLAAGGWQISVIGTLQTGQFLTPTVSIPDPTGTVFTTGRNRPLVSIRPDHLRDGRVANPTIARWFDPTAFAAPPLGRYGTSSRGVLVGPGAHVWHASVQKYFSFSENARIPKIRIEATAENVFNHPNWGLPGTVLTDTGSVATINSIGAASVGYDAVGSRVLRLGLRAEW